MNTQKHKEEKKSQPFQKKKQTAKQDFSTTKS